jgi:hypothetical protein
MNRFPSNLSGSFSSSALEIVPSNHLFSSLNSSHLFSSGGNNNNSTSSTIISLNNPEDYTFLCYLKEIEIRYTIFPKSCRVRIERWIEKLIRVEPSHSLLIKERNLYIRLLLEMIFARSLSYPFTQLPDDGPLPSFPTQFKSRMKNLVGIHESLFWRDLYERLIPHSSNEMKESYPILEKQIEECKEIITELWEQNQELVHVKINYENLLQENEKIKEKLLKKVEKCHEMETSMEDARQVIDDLKEQVHGLEKILTQTQQQMAFHTNNMYNSNQISSISTSSPGSAPSLTWLHNSHAQFLEYQKIYERFHLKVIHALKFSETPSDSGGGPHLSGHSIIQAKEKLNDLLIKQRDDYISELLSHLENYNSTQEALVEKLKNEWERQYRDLSDRYDALHKDYQLSQHQLTDSDLNLQFILSQKQNCVTQIEQFQNKIHLYENYYERLLTYISELEKQRLESSYSMETLVVNALNTLGQPLLIEEEPRQMNSFSRSVFHSPREMVSSSSPLSTPFLSHRSSNSPLSSHVNPPPTPSFLHQHSPIKFRSSP